MRDDTAAGFEADPAFFHAAGPRLGAAVKLAETGIAQTSVAAGLPLRLYRERLRMQYRARLAELRASPDSD